MSDIYPTEFIFFLVITGIAVLISAIAFLIAAIGLYKYLTGKVQNSQTAVQYLERPPEKPRTQAELHAELERVEKERYGPK